MKHIIIALITLALMTTDKKEHSIESILKMRPPPTPLSRAAERRMQLTLRPCLRKVRNSGCFVYTNNLLPHADKTRLVVSNPPLS
ncbi:hypothetical protein CEXT_591811 [Caerostris extrusa]|uniref:Secreted protein n=1 Tax=Caerostris extrusa TaxID=172846 RepID=A0AAV4NWM6_CAEEX|nr:hypothetical protein CEXT_591811 [Caerostris extrusa]